MYVISTPPTCVTPSPSVPVVSSVLSSTPTRLPPPRRLLLSPRRLASHVPCSVARWPASVVPPPRPSPALPSVCTRRSTPPPAPSRSWLPVSVPPSVVPPPLPSLSLKGAKSQFAAKLNTLANL